MKVVIWVGGLLAMLSAASLRADPGDIDLWAFSASSALAPSKTVDEFKAQSGFESEEVQLLNGNTEAKDVKPFPRQVTLKYRDGLRIRVLDYGQQAFVSQIRVSGASWPIHGGLKLGSTRAEVEAVLGKPKRGGQSYSIFEGETDVVRVMYADGKLSSVEIDRGS
ncbi:MAG: hypothetical protein ACT4PG_14755 [Panacagrimonas sp.]